MPLMGKIFNYSATKDREPFIHRKGIYIKGTFGDKIQSIFPGKVVFSDWFKGYGQMIIINHGSRYFTMFAHLEEIKKEWGRWFLKVKYWVMWETQGLISALACILR